MIAVLRCILLNFSVENPVHFLCSCFAIRRIFYLCMFFIEIKDTKSYHDNLQNKMTETVLKNYLKTSCTSSRRLSLLYQIQPVHLLSSWAIDVT